MERIRLEVLPWATRAFDVYGSAKLVLEEEVEEGATVKDLLMKLATKYPNFRELIFDVQGQQLAEPVEIICNGLLLDLLQGLETRLKGGDSLILLPAFAGGQA